MAAKPYFILSNNDESLWLLHLPHNHHGAVWSLWVFHLLHWYLQGLSHHSGGGDRFNFFHLVRRGVLPPPDLFRALPSSRSPHHYLSLRNKRGIRIRNISTICAWLFSSAAMSLVILGNLFLDWCLLILSLILISFFSLSVLHVLIHPGPGEQGAKKERVDQSKQRAFYTIVIVLVELGLRLAWNLVWGVMNESKDSSNCVIITVVFWFSLPSTLVLPLLFLHKTGNYFVVCNKT